MVLNTENLLQNYQQLISDSTPITRATSPDGSPTDVKYKKKDKIKELQKYYSAAGVDIESLIRPAKIISQIIAYLWLNSEDETEAIKWFHFPQDRTNSPGNKPHLYNLMTKGDPRKANDDSNDLFSTYHKFLARVFRHLEDSDYKSFYKFPIYKESGLPVEVSFETDNTVFYGYFKDPIPFGPSLFTVVIPFPPCPTFSPATFEESTLKKWQTNTNKYQILPPNPFIVASC